MTITDDDTRQRPTGRPRAMALLQVLGMAIAAAVLLPALSPANAVGGGPVVRLLFLGRMAVLLILATGLLRLRGLGWSDVGLRRPRGWRFALAIPLGLVVGFGFVGAAGYVNARLGFGAPDYHMFRPLQGNLAEYLYWLIPVTLFSAALGEEMLFRGFFTNALEAVLGGAGRWSTVTAIIVQALIFGVLHLYQGPGGAITAGSIGIALGLVWLVSGRSLWAGILIHAFLDGSAMTAFYLGAAPH